MTTFDAVTKIAKSKPSKKVRVLRELKIGQAIQQGDVYLHRVPDDFPHAEQIGEESVQVALGTSNGARHMAEGEVKVFKGVKLPDGVKAPMDVQAAEIIGPLVIASKTWTLSHTEHPHHRLPKGAYQVTYQYDPITMRRVQD